MNRKIMPIIWHTLMLGWMAVLFLLTRMSGDASGELSMSIVRLVLGRLTFEDHALLNFIVRKLAHFGAYFVLGFFTFFAMRGYFAKKPTHSLWVGFLIAAGYGVFDEIHQYFVPDRVMSGWDMLINASGSIAGAAAGLALVAIMAKRGRR